MGVAKVFTRLSGLALGLTLLAACVTDDSTGSSGSAEARSGKPSVLVIVPNEERVLEAMSPQNKSELMAAGRKLMFVTIAAVAVDLAQLEVFSEGKVDFTFDTPDPGPGGADFVLANIVDLDSQAIGHRWVLIDRNGTRTDIDKPREMTTRDWYPLVEEKVGELW